MPVEIRLAHLWQTLTLLAHRSLRRWMRSLRPARMPAGFPLPILLTALARAGVWQVMQRSSQSQSAKEAFICLWIRLQPPSAIAITAIVERVGRQRYRESDVKKWKHTTSRKIKSECTCTNSIVVVHIGDAITKGNRMVNVYT